MPSVQIVIQGSASEYKNIMLDKYWIFGYLEC